MPMLLFRLITKIVVPILYVKACYVQNLGVSGGPIETARRRRRAERPRKSNKDLRRGPVSGVNAIGRNPTRDWGLQPKRGSINGCWVKHTADGALQKFGLQPVKMYNNITKTLK